MLYERIYFMVKKFEEKQAKERVSIVVSREGKKHLSFIALEKDLNTPGEAVDYLLTYFDRSGNLKKKRETDFVSPEKAIAGSLGERDYIPGL